MSSEQSKNIVPFVSKVYVALGIDGNGFDQVLGVFADSTEAMMLLDATVIEGCEYYDLWIEEHELK